MGVREVLGVSKEGRGGEWFPPTPSPLCAPHCDTPSKTPPSLQA